MRATTLYVAVLYRLWTANHIATDALSSTSPSHYQHVRFPDHPLQIVARIILCQRSLDSVCLTPYTRTHSAALAGRLFRSFFVSANHFHHAASVFHCRCCVNESSAPGLPSGVAIRCDAQATARGVCLEKAQAWSHPIGSTIRVLCAPIVRMRDRLDHLTWQRRRPNRDTDPLRDRCDRERAGLGPRATGGRAHSRQRRDGDAQQLRLSTGASG